MKEKIIVGGQQHTKQKMNLLAIMANQNELEERPKVSIMLKD